MSQPRYAGRKRGADARFTPTTPSGHEVNGVNTTGA